MRLTLLAAQALFLGSALGGCGADAPEPAADISPQREIALYTSLPLIWAESGSIREHLVSVPQDHWSLTVFQRYGRLHPLDVLADAGGRPVLADGDALLVMAQPRPLSPQENVALDEWVRGGGRLLLLADPMLTAGSAFPLGDPRRPEDMAMLSPILMHWGLMLMFDEAQPAGERQAEVFGQDIPVNLAGHFVLTGNSGDCRILSNGLAAECRIGKGRALILADAAVLEDADRAGRRIRAEALDFLLARLIRKD